jgi:hypothetical protein
MRTGIAICLLLALGPWTSSAQEHPFAIKEEPIGMDLSFGRLEWGRTTLAYSHSWMGGQSYSQALLLKDLRAPLVQGLDFHARFGLAFSPGAGWEGTGRQPELVLPYAALHWQPSENFQMRLEYSQPGAAGLYPYGWQDGWGGSLRRPYHPARRSTSP